MFTDLYQKIGTLINKSAKILIVSHRKPDADTLGANIALKIYLESLDKKVVMACVDKPSKAFVFMPHVSEFVNEFDLATFDLMIIVDCGASKLVGFQTKYEEFFTTDMVKISIDHHASNDNFGDLNLVDAKAASATVIIYRMLRHLGAPISSEMATCLLAGIYGDTGSFMHSNVSKEVCEIASELTSLGANISAIVKNIFRNRSVGTLKLWGKVMEKAYVTSDGVVISVMKENDYQQVGASPEQLSGVVDYLNMVPNAKFALLLNEDRKGNVKGSLRTKNSDVDLSLIAAEFGGGGHPKASGFMLQGKLEEAVKYKIVSDILGDNKDLEF